MHAYSCGMPIRVWDIIVSHMRTGYPIHIWDVPYVYGAIYAYRAEHVRKMKTAVTVSKALREICSVEGFQPIIQHLVTQISGTITKENLMRVSSDLIITETA